MRPRKQSTFVTRWRHWDYLLLGESHTYSGEYRREVRLLR